MLITISGSRWVLEFLLAVGTECCTMDVIRGVGHKLPSAEILPERILKSPASLFKVVADPATDTKTQTGLGHTERSDSGYGRLRRS